MEASHRNRRRARSIAAFPGVVVFGLIALVLTALGESLIGLIAGAVAGVLVSTAVVLSASKLLLRSLRARRVDEDDVPRTYNLVEGLCATMGLPLPAMWLVDDETLDALAIGRGHRTAALVLTTGLADSLDPVALEGVLAHELTHIKRCDIAPATVSAGMLLPLAFFIPGTSGLVHRLAGRGREFQTDRLAVAVTRYPPGLREALAAMVLGPAPGARSPLSGRAVARATRWLWTVALPDGATARSGAGGGRSPSVSAGATAGPGTGPTALPASSAGSAVRPPGLEGPETLGKRESGARQLDELRQLDEAGQPSRLSQPSSGSAALYPVLAAGEGSDEEVGELDAALVRIAALDES